MAAKTPIQRDWEQREFVEMVSVNIKKITEFLNKFGTMSCRSCPVVTNG